MTDLIAVAVVAVPFLVAIAFAALRDGRHTDRAHLVCAVAVAVAPLAVAGISLSQLADPLRGSWYVVDPAGAIFLIVIAMSGALTAAVSPSYLAGERGGFFAADRARSSYYAAFYLLWSALMAVALINNLGVAWVLIEVTTAASAVLVAFGGLGKPLEAGWKYLALSTLGLSVTLLGIIVLYAGIGGGASSLSTLNWETLIRLAAQVDHTTALLAFVLILAGLAAKIGWAPVHSWG
ncbi:MAG: hypothetical protein ITG02_12455, partial [Patulibacter sp.]|nr:hypothetical protein [Patulibacter sp.]